MFWILFLIVLALFFDYLNGFHDAANSVATVVSTRVLSPKVAVAWAAFFNFVAFLVFHTGVAKTIGAGIVDIHIVDSNLVFGALMGACVWNILTWWWGLPSSSSHALIGGLIGAGFVKGGMSALLAGGILKTVLFIFLSPLLGFVLSLIIGTLVFNICRPFNPYKVDHFFRKGQLLSAASYSLGHGGNDAQKTMGIISMLLLGGLAGQEAAPIRDFLLTHEEMHQVAQGAFIVPLSVVLLCHGSPRLWACRSARRIQLRAQLWALAPCAAFPACAGAWQTALCGRGLSPFRRRRLFPPSVIC